MNTAMYSVSSRDTSSSLYTDPRNLSMITELNTQWNSHKITNRTKISTFSNCPLNTAILNYPFETTTKNKSSFFTPLQIKSTTYQGLWKRLHVSAHRAPYSCSVTHFIKRQPNAAYTVYELNQVDITADASGCAV
jgi:hypothetical protein